MNDTDARGAWLAALVGPPGPDEPEAAARWARMDATQRRLLRRAAVDLDAARHLETETDRQLVIALASVMIRRSRADVLTPVLTGLLVLSTVWGFGRAAVPLHADVFLVSGLIGMAITTVAGWRRRAGRRADARVVRAAIRAMQPRPPAA